MWSHAAVGLAWTTLFCAAGGAGAEQLLLRVENLTVLPSTQPLLNVAVTNQQPTAFAGTLAINPPPGWRIAPPRPLTLAPGQSTRVAFAIEQGVNSDANSYPLEVVAAGGRGTLARRQNVFCATAPYFKPTIDGDAAEWKDAIAVRFVSGGKQTSISTFWNRKEFAVLVAVEEDRLTPYGGAAAQAPDAVQLAIAPQGSVTGTSPEAVCTRWEYLIVAADAVGGGKCFELARPELKLGQTQEVRPLEPRTVAAARVAVRRVGTTTFYEAALPWQPLREAIPPSEGREFCFAVLVHDPDGTGLRDLGDVARFVPQQRNRLAWSQWPGAQWSPQPPWDNKIEWGLCASKY